MRVDARAADLVLPDVILLTGRDAAVGWVLPAALPVPMPRELFCLATEPDDEALAGTPGVIVREVRPLPAEEAVETGRLCAAFVRLEFDRPATSTVRFTGRDGRDREELRDTEGDDVGVDGAGREGDADLAVRRAGAGLGAAGRGAGAGLCLAIRGADDRPGEDERFAGRLCTGGAERAGLCTREDLLC